MKILHVLSKLEKGGAESRIIEMQKAMYSQEGVIFDYLLREGGNHFYTADAKAMGSTIYVLHQPSVKELLSYIWQIRTLVKGDYDIVHSHLSVFSGFVLLGAKLGGAKIRIAHSRSGPLPSEVKKFPIKRKILLKFYHYLIKYTATHRISCSSDAAIYLYGKKAVKNNDVIYIRNAVEFRRFDVKTNLDDIRKRYCIQNEEVFVSIGNLLPVKNHIYLIEVFNEYHKMNPNTILFIAGEGPERKAIEEKIEQLNNKNIILLGRCDTIPELLAIADYFILASKYEGVPGAAIEAMASGVPCYLSDKITRDIDFGEEITRYFSIEAEPRVVAKMINETCKKMKHSKMDFQKILFDNGYEINSACSDMLNIYKGHKQ